ncbi:flagellar biosynthesis protein FlgN [Aliiroseovarius subalbicans]|uniref:flagellar biosynthesis protein FlgN n=1 Tax=Aliiroseovarius subalbicans TaxID=2925840 RepID=UPI001F58D755|nr:flagellar biosynthesis protein FlgN [Aliiroseovarius subalbicans]MCI2400223.1 flagellar biosynthesis protein FlgN [Aliiroseovarius subalbicans]
MVLFDLPDIPAALERLLDHERQLILLGNFDGLVRVAPEKDKLLARLQGATDDASVVERIRTKADRNQELLVAVARGIKSVSRQLEALKTRKSQLRTYDAGGQSANLMPAKSTFERRA